MNVSLLKLDKELPTPERAHPDDAGLDLHARHPLELEPGQRSTVDTGIALAIPPGYAGLVLPRSGMASRYGIGVVNGPGLIDAGYRGEIRVVLVNLGERRVSIARGDRIAQMLILPIAVPVIEIVESLDATERGWGGFGSSGR